MDKSRRQFIQTSSMAMLGAGAASVFAQSDDYTERPGNVEDAKQKPTIVSIYLRGGADSLSMIVPHGDDMYYNYRKSTAIPAQGNRGVLPFHDSNYFGLNPNLEALRGLMEDGKCVPIINCGSTHGTRSHFDAQDYMERAAPGLKSVRQGWLNRYLYMTKKPYDAPLRGISPQRLLPRALRGRYPVLAGYNATDNMDMFEQLYAESNMVNKTAREGAGKLKGTLLEDDVSDRIKGMERDKPLRTADMARDIITESGTSAVKRLRALEQALYSQGNDAQYPGGGLGRQLSQIARVIKANVGLEVAQADYGGWDTHSGQGGVDGNMGRKLKHVADSMAAFYKDLGPRMDKVLVLVMTEFGRTVHENGNNGTDHGHGGLMFAMGGMLKGDKPMYGEWTGMATEKLKYRRFMPVTTDFRIVFAESLYNLFGFDPFKVDYFPGYKPKKGDLLNFLNPIFS